MPFGSGRNVLSILPVKVRKTRRKSLTGLLHEKHNLPAIIYHCSIEYVYCILEFWTLGKQVLEPLVYRAQISNLTKHGR